MQQKVRNIVLLILLFIVISMMSFLSGTAFGAYSDVDSSLAGSYKKTSSLSTTDMKDSTQKNYQGAGADNNYIFETAEWTNQDNGEAKISVRANQDAQGMTTEYSAVYFLNLCMVHGQTVDLVKKDVKWLIEKYGALDVVFYSIEQYANYDGAISKYEQYHYTSADIPEIDRWTAGGATMASIVMNGRIQPYVHASSGFAWAARKYFFGDINKTPNESNLVHNPNVVYTSSDGYITWLPNAEEAACATDDLFRFLADKYVTGLDKKRWYSTTSQQSPAAYASVASEFGARITSASFNPEYWFGSGSYNADYNYEQSFETLNAEVVYPDYSITGTISNNFDIVSSDIKMGGQSVSPKIEGNKIVLEFPGYEGGEISGTINLKLNSTGWSNSNKWIDVNSDGFKSSYSNDLQVDSPKLAVISDLDIVKVVSQSKAQAGDKVSYTITVTNKGKGLAQESIVKDTLPNGLVISGTPTASKGTAEVSPDKRSLQVKAPNIAGGESYTIKYDAEVEGSASGTLTNKAAVNGNGQAEKTASASVSILKPKLSVSLVADNTSYQIDDTITYTMTITNSAQGTTARQVKAENTLPSDFIIQSDISSSKGQATVNDASNSWSADLGDLDYNASISIVYHAVVGKDARTTDYTNIAKASALYTDSAEDNAVVTIIAPLLSISKKSLEDIVQNDDTVNYDIKIENAGAGETRNLVIRDIIPDEVEVDVPQISMDFYSISGEVVNGDNITFNIALVENEFNAILNAPLPAKTGLTLHLPTIVGGDVKPCMISNTAYANADNVDQLTASDNTVQVVAPELKINKSSNAVSAQVNDTITYKVIVQNFGEGSARNVVTEDDVPAEFTLLPETLKYEERDLIVIEGDKIDAVIPDFDGSDITEGEEIGWNNNDDTDFDWESSDVEPLNDGFAISTLSNDLFEETPIVDDEEENGQEDESDDSSNSINQTGNSKEFVVDGNKWTLKLDHPLPSQKEIMITFDVVVNEIPSGTVTNTATTDADHVDLLTSEASLIDVCDVEVIEPKLEIMKTVDKEFAQAGDILSYNIVINNTGNGEARNLTVVDELPDTLSLIGDIQVSNESTTTDIQNMRDITIVVPSLPPTEEISISYQVAVQSNIEMGAEILNIANTYADYSDVESSSAKTYALIPGMNIIKTADVEEAMPGDKFNYTITLIQNGDEGSTEDNLVITDTMPDGITIDGTASIKGEAKGNETLENGKYSISIPSMKQGEQIQITLPVLSNSSVAGKEIINTAYLTSDQTLEISSSAKVNFGTPQTPIPQAVPVQTPKAETPTIIPQLPKTGEIILLSGGIIAVLGIGSYMIAKHRRSKKNKQ